MMWAVAAFAALALSSTASAQLVGEPIAAIDLSANNNNNGSRLSLLAINERSCFQYKGIDIKDKDVGNAPGNVDSCCNKCRYEVANCNAYTWTNYNGGTCWFKSFPDGEKLSYSINEGAVSGRILVPQVNPWDVAFGFQTPGYDSYGNEIGYGEWTANINDCALKCLRTGQCNLVAYTPANQRCYLKTAFSSLVVDSGVQLMPVFRCYA